MIARSAPSDRDLARILDEVCADPDEYDIVYRARNRIVVRHPGWGGGSLVIKMWARPDVKGAVRRLIGRSAPRNEWVNLRRFRDAGVRVPMPYGFLHARRNAGGFTEALFLEDLGETVSGMNHVHRLIEEGREDEMHRFETELITMTARCLDAGLIDRDHGLVNTVVPADGHAVRLDLELARRVHIPRLFPTSCGNMLGNLLGTYAFAVQPETERVTRFAERLASGVRVPSRTLRHTAVRVQYMMDYQRRKAGIVTKVQLPWS